MAIQFPPQPWSIGQVYVGPNGESWQYDGSAWNSVGSPSPAGSSGTSVLESPGGCYMKFDSSVLVQPGEYAQIVAKNLGTVTPGGTITFPLPLMVTWSNT